MNNCYYNCYIIKIIIMNNCHYNCYIIKMIRINNFYYNRLVWIIVITIDISSWVEELLSTRRRVSYRNNRTDNWKKNSWDNVLIIQLKSTK